MADTELQQLIVWVGTTEKIEQAMLSGIITENDFAITTDAPDFQTKLTSANAGTGISITEVNGIVKISNTQTSAEWGNIQGSIQTQTDLWNYLSQIGVLSSLSTTAKTDLVSAINEVYGIANTALQPSDVVNTTGSTATNKPLSAAMGKSLQDQVDNLSARGRFLALWNCATGLAQSNPPESPYTYKTGDYFIVGTVASGGGTNYRPSGSSYTTGVASTTVETAEVSVDDVYYYDGSNWRLQTNTQKTLSFANIAGDPYDNTNLAGALNAKQDDLTPGGGIAIDTDTNTISNTGVRGVSTGSTNGTISVNTNGTSTEVSVAGLGSAAFTASTDYAQASALNDYVTLNTVQTITAAKSIVGTDYGTGMQKNIFAALSTESSAQPGWKGRMLVGAKDLTFLMGSYSSMAGLGAHSWTDSAAATGAAWADFYLNPDGNKTVYIGGYNWKINSGWFRVQNTGSINNGKIQVNKGDINTPDWKDVAYKGENISDFNNDALYQSQSTIETLSATDSITLADNTIYNGGEQTALTIALPATVDVSFLCEIDFTSGTTPATLAYPNTIKWVGDDVANNVFVPVASKRYTIICAYDGVNYRFTVKGVA